MGSMHGIPFERYSTVRIGLIGLGGRGYSQLGELLGCEGVQISALADLHTERVERAAARIQAADQPPPATFVGDNGWRQLIDSELDLVYITTSWSTHTPYAVAAMRAGKHVAVEVPAAVTLEECWALVETSEQTRQHCVMLENCCYDYWETLVKRMVQGGVLGTLTHAECAYIHDLRAELFRERHDWRRQAHVTRNGNLYPTHGLGPVAQCLGIGQEDAFDYLVSMSSPALGLAHYRKRHLPADNPAWDETYRCGDMNTSLIRTKRGRTIVLQHDSATPRPYDRIFLLAGTKGIFRDYPPRLFLDEVGDHTAWPPQEAWIPLEAYRQQWEDPLWTHLGELARKRGGHGGMDFIMNYRLIQTMREGLSPDMDVYDAADWCAPGPLSEQSVAHRSAAVDFPNFRRTP
jgi:predicted dehydrogenase